MKVIFLNCWYSKLEDDLLNFLKFHSNTTDIFCFQEVSKRNTPKINSILKNYFLIRNHNSNNIYNKHQAMYIHKDLEFVKNKSDFISVFIKNKKTTLVNVHGESLPGHKLDTKKRIILSKEIIELCNKSDHSIIGGDFNLMPRTKSIKMFEENGYRNLIKEFKIRRTRNKYAWKQAENLQKKLNHKFYGKQKFSDYCFVSSEVNVKDFEVPNIEVSDHLPLILEFEV